MPYAADSDGIRLAVRLTPRADRNRVDGIVADADGGARLQLRLTAPPVEGAANAALVAFLAKELRLRKSDIELRAGDRSRLKMLFLRGDPATIMARLKAWVEG